MKSRFCLLVLMVLMVLPPAWLYSLHNCNIDVDEPWKVLCLNFKLSRIPPDIPKTVKILKLGINNIQRIREGDFSGFNELQSLSFTGNEIYHIEDAAFSHLSGLTELRLGRNRLTNLTNGMFQGLSNLTFLDLENNNITNIHESVFAPLEKLQKLDLSQNRLSNIRDIVKAVSFSPLLNVLDLGSNNFTSFEFENIPFPLNIAELSLNANPLNSFMLHSDVFPRLQTLHLSPISSKFQWNVSDKAFLKSLKTLDLSYTRFRKETYQSIFQSVLSVENFLVRGVDCLNKGLLDWACGTLSLQKITISQTQKLVLNNSFLQSCSHLTELDLSCNFLTDVPLSALQMLTRLSKLDMRSNRLTRVPLTIRNMSSLTALLFQANHIRKLDCLDFSNLRLLAELDLSGNQLFELNSCVFRDLHSLEKLDIGGNFILEYDDSITLSKLRVLNAAGNKIEFIPEKAFNNMSRLTELHLDSEKGMFVEYGTFDGLKNLTILSYTPCVFVTDTLVGSNSTSRGRPQAQQMFSLPSLQTLQISAFGQSLYRNPYYLKGLDNLKEFLSENIFSEFVNVDLFSYTPHLLYLKMKEKKAWSPVPVLFHPITALQTLDLSDNHLKSLDFLLEANLTQLQKLILRNNDLSVINEKVFEALPSLQYLDLSQNPFACNCSNADFIRWAIFNRQVYVDRAFQYLCASPPSHQGLHLLDFNFRSCWESVGFLCFISSSALVLLTLLCCFVHHLLRFQLLYGFYLLRAFLYHRQKQRRGCAQVYDAFVSYNVHDEEWVYRELVPELEGRQGWRLCLHHRDFQPGKAILENITDAIYSSRKTLCVISQQYLHSEWCSREIQMASFRLLDEKKDVLVLLFLEELSSNQLSPFFRMRKLLRRRTYVSWSGVREHRGLFWERVRHALQSGAELPAEGPLPPDV